MPKPSQPAAPACTLESAAATIGDLAQNFSQAHEYYIAPQYSEAMARNDFISKFFIALGWDVNHDWQKNPLQQEVRVERSVHVGGESKRADYAFFIHPENNRKPLWFLEAKKPSEKLDRQDYCFQAIRYAWHGSTVKIAVLFNFAELILLDARYKPHKDSAQARIIKRYHWQDYDKPEKFAEIFGLLARPAVADGSLEKFAQSLPTPRKAGLGKNASLFKGVQALDEAFLADMDGWREQLAAALKKANAELDSEQLTEITQRVLDRLIFIRFLEDKQILDREILSPLCDSPDAWPKFIAESKRLDGIYNGIVFKPHHLLDVAGFSETSGALQNILTDLAGQYSPYLFDLIPIHVLGSIYERFLGKVIRATPKGAKLEEKEAVRKAGGVYYTPEYIVRYIVRHTVGELIKNKTPQEILQLRFADIACGSGSFLLGIYDELLQTCADWYQQHPREAQRQGCQSLPDGGWRLSLAQRREFLLACIYGVDIDAQAVEVAQLSLYLKLLEDESTQTTRQYSLDHKQEKLLPPLSANIVCGNSLVGRDILDGQLFDNETLKRLKPIDFSYDFPQVIKNGGFDAVIGNPPYGAELDAVQKQLLHNIFSEKSKSLDSYELFMLQAKNLIRVNGRMSMIIPASWLTGEKFAMSRKELVNKLSPVIAYALPFDVFPDAYIDTAIVVLAAGEAIENCLIHYFSKKEQLSVIPDGIGNLVQIKNIRSDGLCRLSILLSTDALPILKKINSGQRKLRDYFDIQRGVQPYSSSKHSTDQIKTRFLHAKVCKTKQHLPELQGNELARYFIAGQRISFIKYCDEIASSRSMHMFEGDRIVLRRLLTRKFRLQASFASETMITTDNIINMVPKNSTVPIKFALGVLNSKLISWVYVNSSMIAQKDDFPQVHISAISKINLPDCGNAHQDKIAALVDRMLRAKKLWVDATTDSDKMRYEREGIALDYEIDAQIYELYGLNEKEIALIEGRK